MPAEKRTTQSQHPWRASFRTAFQAVVALAASWAIIVETLGIEGQWPWVGTSIAVAAAITRTMSLPEVEEWLARFLPWLAADPGGSAWHAGRLPER